jgi:hypothetical protein
MKNKITTILCLFLMATSITSQDHESKRIKRWMSDLTWMNKPEVDVLDSFEDLTFNRELFLETDPKKEFNVPEEKQEQIYRWETRDFNNRNWFSQGTAGSYALIPGKHILVVSWYAKNDVAYKGSRLTFVDMERKKYRHVLLVKPTKHAHSGKKQQQSYESVSVHAGGIAIIGHLIYVTNGNQGLRVFDADLIFKTVEDPTQKKIGIHDGKAYAYNYKYAIPQVAHYKFSQLDMKFSSLSLERGEQGELWLWSASFTDYYRSTPRVLSLKIDKNGWIADYGDDAFPKDSNGEPVYHVQGVFRLGDQTYLTRTSSGKYKKSHSRLVGHQDGDRFGKRWRWPHMTEDLYYDHSTKQLWCNTEKPGVRYLFSVDLEEYQ